MVIMRIEKFLTRVLSFLVSLFIWTNAASSPILSYDVTVEYGSTVHFASDYSGMAEKLSNRSHCFTFRLTLIPERLSAGKYLPPVRIVRNGKVFDNRFSLIDSECRQLVVRSVKWSDAGLYDFEYSAVNISFSVRFRVFRIACSFLIGNGSIDGISGEFGTFGRQAATSNKNLSIIDVGTIVKFGCSISMTSALKTDQRWGVRTSWKTASMDNDDDDDDNDGSTEGTACDFLSNNSSVDDAVIVDRTSPFHFIKSCRTVIASAPFVVSQKFHASFAGSRTIYTDDGQISGFGLSELYDPTGDKNKNKMYWMSPVFRVRYGTREVRVVNDSVDLFTPSVSTERARGQLTRSLTCQADGYPPPSIGWLNVLTGNVEWNETRLRVPISSGWHLHDERIDNEPSRRQLTLSYVEVFVYRCLAFNVIDGRRHEARSDSDVLVYHVKDVVNSDSDVVYYFGLSTLSVATLIAAAALVVLLVLIAVVTSFIACCCRSGRRVEHRLDRAINLSTTSLIEPYNCYGRLPQPIHQANPNETVAALNGIVAVQPSSRTDFGLDAECCTVSEPSGYDREVTIYESLSGSFVGRERQKVYEAVQLTA